MVPRKIKTKTVMEMMKVLTISLKRHQLLKFWLQSRRQPVRKNCITSILCSSQRTRVFRVWSSSQDRSLSQTMQRKRLNSKMRSTINLRRLRFATSLLGRSMGSAKISLVALCSSSIRKMEDQSRQKMKRSSKQCRDYSECVLTIPTKCLSLFL